jgi:hypothetical protein
MHDKRIGEVLDGKLLLDFGLLVASVALVSFNYFALNHAF